MAVFALLRRGGRPPAEGGRSKAARQHPFKVVKAGVFTVPEAIDPFLRDIHIAALRRGWQGSRRSHPQLGVRQSANLLRQGAPRHEKEKIYVSIQ